MVNILRVRGQEWYAYRSTLLGKQLNEIGFLPICKHRFCTSIVRYERWSVSVVESEENSLFDDVEL